MAINISRTGWMDAFIQRRSPNGFLQSLFTIKPGNIYNGKKVSIDIQRFGEQIALVVEHGTGPRLNDLDIFTTKEFTPPQYGEALPFDVEDLVERMVGVDPFTAAYTEYSSQLLAYMITGFAAIDDKIKRAVELQASQILTTGKLDLKDDAGATLYSLDFQPKATHFVTTGTSWGPGVGDPIGDLQSLANVIRADGKVNPDRLIFGDGVALREFLNNAEVQSLLDNRRFEMGEIAPQFANSGATFYGFIWIGAYKFEIWCNPEMYEDPENPGTLLPYVPGDKVIMLSSQTRLDRTSARVPLPLGPDPRVSGLLPGRVSSSDANFDVTPNMHCTPNGKQIMGELESRTLLIPVQIDGFGCLDTVI
jgi:hypothetical protein